MNTGRGALPGVAVLVCLPAAGGCGLFEQDVDATGTWTGPASGKNGRLKGSRRL